MSRTVPNHRALIGRSYVISSILTRPYSALIIHVDGFFFLMRITGINYAKKQSAICPALVRVCANGATLSCQS